MNRILLLFCCLLLASILSSPATAQSDIETTIEEDILPAVDIEPLETQDAFEEAVEKEIKHPEDTIITLTLENDSFGRGTDQNYTHGTRITWFDFQSEFPQLMHDIADWVPTFEINESSSIHYSVGQNLFTPDDITARTPDPNDRPYAGFLYGSVGMSSYTNNHIDDLEVVLGVVGSLALGEETQKIAHDIAGADDPNGWDHQLENEPGLILSWQRRWPALWHSAPLNLEAGITPHIGLTLGNVYTYASTGLTFRIGQNKSAIEDNPVRVRPAIPGTGFFDIPADGWDWFVFAGVEGRAMGRNIFLDGNTFRDGPRVGKHPFVLDSNLGLVVTIGQTRLSYTLVHRSKEFKGQDRADLFGAISIGYRF